MNTSFYSPVTN